MKGFSSDKSDRKNTEMERILQMFTGISWLRKFFSEIILSMILVFIHIREDMHGI